MKICIVSHNSYGALIGDETRHIGGVEIQTNLMARWLTKNGHKVSVIVWGENNGVVNDIDGIEIIQTCEITSGIPLVRFFYPRWSSLISALKKSNADIYYQNCGEYITGQVAIWCKINSRKFVYSVASDPDCDVNLPKMKKIRERIFYRYGLKSANLVIVQTKKQMHMLKEGFNLRSYVHPMPSKDPKINYSVEERHRRFNVLWVGRLTTVKRLDRLIEIAKELEDCQFTVIGGADQDEEYASELMEQMNGRRNIQYLGRIKHAEMQKYYEKSSILCCTSDYEGFPNTFLEAWALGLPIVSTIDPDNVIADQAVGAVCTSITDFVNSIRRYQQDRVLYEEVSVNARLYFEVNHAEDSSVNRFLESFKKLALEP